MKLVADMSDLFIDDYINKIVLLEKQIGAYVGYKPMEPFWVPGKGFMDSRKLQGAAKAIADFIGLSQYTFLVTVSKQKAAGKIELTYSGSDVFVEISDNVQCFEDSVVATLAHELTHKYMQVNGIAILSTNLVQEYENEVLTDITSIFLGLGKFLLNGCNNVRTYEEYRGVDRYKVTKTMTVGYLTQSQMAFVYRLICSMRGVSKECMISNLNKDAKEAVQSLDNYNDDYFNVDFKHEYYRKIIADETSKRLLQLQNSLDEVEKKMNYIGSEIIQLRESVQGMKEKTFDLLQESEHLTVISSFDPCMKYLENIAIKRWKKLTISTVINMHERIEQVNKVAKKLKSVLRHEANESHNRQKIKSSSVVIIAIIATILLGVAVYYLSTTGGLCDG